MNGGNVMIKPRCDVAIVGGGIMGMSTAYNLLRGDDRLEVVVVERDPTYAQASTTLSWGNVRIHFSLKENVRISLYAMEFLEKFGEHMEVDGEQAPLSWHRDGNLFLVSDKALPAAREAFEMQKSLGCEVEWLSVEEIGRRYPLYDLSGIAAGTFGPNEGYLDGHDLLQGYRRKASSLGATFVKDEVTEILAGPGCVEGIRLASGADLKAGTVINCSGAWTTKLLPTVGIKLPIAPTMRQVFAVDTAVKPEGPLPLTVFPSGFCFRSEIGRLLFVGKGMSCDAVGFEFVWDDKRFMEVLWPELAERVPAFDTLKLVRGWAGLYDINTWDGNAFLGEWPELRGLYLANGFSGHGLQQGPAVGRYLSELIRGISPSLDLSVFSPKRILEGKPLSETGLV
jgi:FAD-dependent oxidoreductase domain-containing protein 1